MKKLSLIAVTLLVAGVANCLAQATGSILFGPVNISFKGVLSDKTKVTDATLTGAPGVGGGTLEFAEVEFSTAVSGGAGIFGNVVSGQVVDVLGTGIGTVNVGSTNVPTNDVVGTVIYGANDAVDLSKQSSKSQKYIAVFGEVGAVLATNGVTLIKSNLDTVVSNSVLLVSSTLTDPKSSTNVTAKVSGIWFAGKTSVAGTVGKAK